jgi:glycyl-tRNA synthetase beta subunit
MSGDIKELLINPYIKRKRFLYSIDKEEKLFNELKKLINDLEKTSDEFDYSDATSSSLKLRAELKCRGEDYDTLLIEKYKWDKLMEYTEEKVYYINSTPKRVVLFDIKQLPEPTWEVQKHNKTTMFENNEKIDKVVGFYSIETQSKDLTKRLYKVNEI